MAWAARPLRRDERHANLAWRSASFPVGAGIGAVGGAILGAIGFGGREKARVYDLKTVRPALKNNQDSYDQGSMDYLTAFSAMQTLQNQAFAAISPMGPAARAYRNDTIDPEIKPGRRAKLSARPRSAPAAATTRPRLRNTTSARTRCPATATR